MSSDRLQRLYDDVARCNRCGFCQNACPVHRVTGDESNVARGRRAAGYRGCAEAIVDSASGVSAR